MLNRLISLLLAAAIIGCPIWCGHQPGHSGGCCAFPGDVTGPLEDSQTGAICCCASQHASSACQPLSDPDAAGDPSESPLPAPDGCPDESSCQGICGGAVIDKSRSWPEISHLSSLLTIDADVDAPRIENLRRRLDAIAHWDSDPQLSKGNYGRLVRLRHCSLLC